MPAAQEPDDDALLAELADVLRPWTVPPPEVVEAAKQSFTWRTIDAELADLAYDSLLDDRPAFVRSAGQPRILTFDAGELTIEVEVNSRPGERRMSGQLVPGQAAELELRAAAMDWAGEPVTTRADALGRFALSLPADLQRVTLRCRLANGTVVETAATVL